MFPRTFFWTILSYDSESLPPPSTVTAIHRLEKMAFFFFLIEQFARTLALFQMMLLSHVPWSPTFNNWTTSQINFRPPNLCPVYHVLVFQLFCSTILIPWFGVGDPPTHRPNPFLAVHKPPNFLNCVIPWSVVTIPPYTELLLLYPSLCRTHVAKH